jgi:hypothetical protein
MNIILGEDNAKSVDQKYTVLELDTIVFPGIPNPVTAYCIVEQIPLEEIVNIDNMRELHSNLVKNYHLKNWNYCEQAIDHLRGKWNGELDTFYNSLLDRVKQYRDQELDDDWNGYIVKA